MHSASVLAQVFALACYVVSAVLYLVNFLGETPRRSSLAGLFLLAGVLSQFVLLLILTGMENALPLRTVWEALLVVCVFTGGSYFLFERATGERTVGPFLVPLLAIICFFSVVLSFLPKAGPESEIIFRSAWFDVHVLLTLLSYAAFAFAFSTGLMYLVLSREIALKRMGIVFVRLPSLDSLDHIGYRAVSIGFPLLTLGVAAGGIWAERVWGGFFRMEMKEALSLATWIIYAAYLHSRLTAGWQGRRAAFLSIAGFVISTVAFIGGSFFAGRHNF